MFRAIIIDGDAGELSWLVAVNVKCSVSSFVLVISERQKKERKRSTSSKTTDATNNHFLQSM
jgi:hypothetical protein